MEPPSPWKKPNEVMRLHKLKKRKQALQVSQNSFMNRNN